MANYYGFLAYAVVNPAVFLGADCTIPLGLHLLEEDLFANEML